METLQSRLIRPKNMQEYNAYIVLEYLKHHGPSSRADISRALGFSRSAISNIVGLLEDYRLVRDFGIGHPHTGRKSRLLEFNPHARFFVGVDLSWQAKRFALVDLSGAIVEAHTARFEASSPAALVEGITSGVEAVLSRLPAHDADNVIEGIGIMVPGLVDSDLGSILYSRSVPWDPTASLTRIVQERFGIPCWAENDANALAMGEDWVGTGRHYSSLAYLFLADGVGGAFISKNTVLIGADNAASEFGKMIVPGSNGPVQAEHELLELIEMLRRQFGQAGEETQKLFRRAAEAYANGDSPAAPLVDRIVSTLIYLICNIVAVLNPEVVIVNSPYIDHIGGILLSVEKRVTSLLPSDPHRTVRLVRGLLNQQTGVLGGAAIAVRRSRFRFLMTGAGNTPIGDSTEGISVGKSAQSQRSEV